MTISPASGPGLDPQVAVRARDEAARPPPALIGATKAPPAEAARAPAEAAPASQTPSAEQLRAAVAEINRALRQSNRNLEFSVDADTHRLVVRMTDSETGELIRQIPSEETLAIARSIGEFQQGLLLKQTA